MKRQRRKEADPGRSRSETRVTVTEFKATCLQLLEQVRQTQEEIVVTKHGKPIAKVAPYAPGSEELFGYLSGTVTVHGDIVAPTGEAWEADAD